MSDTPKVTYHAKSFTVDKLEMVQMHDLNAAEGKCFVDFLRRQEQEILRLMGLPADLMAAQRAKRESQLRAIMGDDFVEDNEHAPGALAYWSRIAEL